MSVAVNVQAYTEFNTLSNLPIGRYLCVWKGGYLLSSYTTVGFVSNGCKLLGGGSFVDITTAWITPIVSLIEITSPNNSIGVISTEAYSCQNNIMGLTAMRII